MNIGEANDINTVGRHLLGIPDGAGGYVTEEQTLEALERLTGKAYKTLGAGLRPEDIRESLLVEPVGKHRAAP